MGTIRFKNRQEAGQRLAQALDGYKGQPAVIYGLPRGGVEIGAEVAAYLNAPLDLAIPRKIGHPSNPEYAICAVTENGHLICNADEIADINQTWLQRVVTREQTEAQRRRQRYLSGRSPVDAKDKLAIITDDGVATGLTMLAAIHDVRARSPASIIVAVPVIPQDSADLVMEAADDLIALEVPAMFMGAIGDYYDQFEQVEDETIVELLDRLQIQQERTTKA